MAARSPAMLWLQRRKGVLRVASARAAEAGDGDGRGTRGRRRGASRGRAHGRDGDKDGDRDRKEAGAGSRDGTSGSSGRVRQDPFYRDFGLDRNRSEGVCDIFRCFVAPCERLRAARTARLRELGKRRRWDDVHGEGWVDEAFWRERPWGARGSTLTAFITGLPPAMRAVVVSLVAGYVVGLPVFAWTRGTWCGVMAEPLQAGQSPLSLSGAELVMCGTITLVQAALWLVLLVALAGCSVERAPCCRRRRWTLVRGGALERLTNVPRTSRALVLAVAAAVLLSLPVFTLRHGDACALWGEAGAPSLPSVHLEWWETVICSFVTVLVWMCFAIGLVCGVAAVGIIWVREVAGNEGRTLSWLDTTERMLLGLPNMRDASFAGRGREGSSDEDDEDEDGDGDGDGDGDAGTGGVKRLDSSRTPRRGRPVAQMLDDGSRWPRRTARAKRRGTYDSDSDEYSDDGARDVAHAMAGNPRVRGSSDTPLSARSASVYRSPADVTRRQMGQVLSASSRLHAAHLSETTFSPGGSPYGVSPSRVNRLRARELGLEGQRPLAHNSKDIDHIVDSAERRAESMQMSTGAAPLRSSRRAGKQLSYTSARRIADASAPRFQLALAEPEKERSAPGDRVQHDNDKVATRRAHAELGLDHSAMSKCERNVRTYIARFIRDELLPGLHNNAAQLIEASRGFFSREFVNGLQERHAIPGADHFGQLTLVEMAAQFLAAPDPYGQYVVVTPGTGQTINLWQQRLQLERFLNVRPGLRVRRYVVERLASLTADGYMGSFQPSGGASFDSMAWTREFPTDTELLLHVFTTIMDQKLQRSQREERPFSRAFVLDGPLLGAAARAPRPHPMLHALRRPDGSLHLRVIADAEPFPVISGPKNLFRAIVVFFALCEKSAAGVLSPEFREVAGTVLGSSDRRSGGQGGSSGRAGRIGRTGLLREVL